MADKKQEQEAVFTKPASQVWQEEQLESGFASPSVLSTYGDQPKVENDSDEAYVGVDPIYQNYADDTHKPLRADEGVEAELEESVYGDDGSKAKTEDVKSEDTKSSGDTKLSTGLPK